MKIHLSFLALLCTLLFTSAPDLVAQCTIPLLDIKDSVTIKALKIYINTTDARNLKREGKYIDEKSTIVLVEEKQIHQTDGRTLKVLEVNMAQMNYYKHWKMSIIGYFYIDKVLFLVTSPFMGLFTTKNYDYDTCLSQVLQNHSIREYDAPKELRKSFTIKR
jgi:hypothetical protein